MRCIVRAVVGLALAAGPAAGQIPVGTEFQANTYTTNRQQRPSVAVAREGQFVVTWSGYPAQDGDSYGVFARRYSASGIPIDAADFQVNSWTTGSQFRSDVAHLGDKLVVVWESRGQDGDSAGVFARLFHAEGGPASGEFRVNPFTTGFQGGPSVTADPTGGFIVTWGESSTYQNRSGAFGRRFDSAGVPVGGDFPLASGGGDIGGLAVNADGSFVVAGPVLRPNNDADLAGQRYDASGAPLGPPFAVHGNTTEIQNWAAVAVDAQGNFVVAWNNYDTLREDLATIAFRIYDANAVPLTEATTVSAMGSFFPAAAADRRGDFIVAWQQEQQVGQPAGVFGQRVSMTGSPVGPAFRINTQPFGGRWVDVASDDDGYFVAVWEGADYALGGVLGQRFASDLIHRDDFESGSLSRWDASTIDPDLEASPSAALVGSQGLMARVDDTAPLFVQDDSPRSERRYRARFYLDPNGFDPGESQAHRRTRVFIAFAEGPSRRVAAVVLRRLNGLYGLMGRARLDDNAQADSGFVTIADGPHWVEIDLMAATGPDAFDGSFEIWIDGVSAARLTGLDNNAAGVDFARLGALSVKIGATGTLFFDDFDSRRSSRIGP
jgi:hypothetical protein